MPCHKSIFISLLCPRGLSQVFLPLCFFVDGIRNPTRVSIFSFPSPFLVPTILCTRPYLNRPIRIPFPKRLPWSLVFYRALTSTRCLPRPCIQQQYGQWFHFFRDILYSVHLEPIFSLLSTTLSLLFVLASSWLRMSSFHVSSGSTRDDIRLLVLSRIDFAVLLSCSFQFSRIPLPSANKSFLFATFISILLLHQSTYRQVSLVSLQTSVSL